MTEIAFARNHRLLLSAALTLSLGLSGSALAQTSSSTAGLNLPETTGVLPRAPMPTGGVDDGMDRSGVVGGTKDGMDRAGQVGGHTDGSDAASQPKPEEPHCHEHDDQASGRHDHCHDHKDGEGHAHPHRGADQHCHEHEHGGAAHSHCPDGTGADHQHTAADSAMTGTVDETPPMFGFVTEDGVAVRWTGFFRGIVETVENDSSSALIGRSDGFRLAQARLETHVSFKKLSALISLEAAVGVTDGFNDANSNFAVRPRDAYLNYALSDFAQIRFGRFKTPYDLALIQSSADRIFIDQSLESRGVVATQGLQSSRNRGMSQDRQLGIMVFMPRHDVGESKFGISYALALTNGRTFNLALNDNDKFAGFARVSFMWADLVSLNFAGFADTRTEGELPDLFDEDVKGFEGSLEFKWEGIRVEGQILYQNIAFETSERPSINALGAHVSGAYTIWNTSFGYRFSYYDPNSKDLEDADALTEHTLAISYNVPSYNLRIGLAGTVAQEQQGRRIDNNRIALLAQFRF